MNASPTITAKTNTDLNRDSLSNTLDSSWLKSSFIIRDEDIINGDLYGDFIRKNRYYSSADLKFTSTSPGMNMAVNPKPQFTRYCDIRSKGKLKNRPDINVGTTGHPNGLGMGRYYSEAFDDNQQRVFFRFGSPQYTPLLLWMTKSFDVDKAVLHNRGVITGTLLQAINVTSKFFAIAAAPILAVGMFALNVAVQSTRFYSVRDTMYTYWATVENILNSMVTRRTMVPHVLPDYSFKLDNTMNRERKVSPNFVNELSSLIPDVIDPETGRISVFAIALRSQAAFNRMLREDLESSENFNPSSDFTGYPLNERGSHDTYFTNRDGKPGFFVDKVFKRAYDLLISDNKDEAIDTSTSETTEQSSIISFNPLYTGPNGEPLTIIPNANDPSDSTDNQLANNVVAKRNTFNRYKEYMLAELSEGAAFAVFNVENTGSVGESFSNSSTSNPIESTFNSLSAKARNMTNLLSSAVDFPVIGDVLKFAADAGATIISNGTFGIANPLLALAYGVNISMPKVWESSSATLPRASYKMKLISPYGNSYSQLFNIYLPLSMIMAGSFPRSTGASSYTSPFVCQLFDRGRVNIQLGMIDNVNITRGTSNLAFSRNGHANAIDVDFSVANFDEVVSIDVNSNGVLSKFLDVISPDFSDTPFTTYINTITGVDVYSQVYRVPILRLKLAERKMALKAITNPDPAAFAAMTVNKMPFEGISKLLLGNNTNALQDLTHR